jgi:hypothetical protein
MWAAFKTFISGNIASLLEILGIAAAATAAVVGVRKSGADAQRLTDLQGEIKGAGVRNEVEQKVDAGSDAGNLAELQQWDRK